MSKQFKQIKGSQAVGPKGQGASFEHQESYDDSLLPDAQELTKLQALDPDIMPWIKDRTAKEQDARHDFNNRRLALLEKGQSRAYRVDLLSIILAFIIMMTGMWFSYALISLDKVLYGSVFAGLTIFFAVKSFLNFRKNNSELKKKP